MIFRVINNTFEKYCNTNTNTLSVNSIANVGRNTNYKNYYSTNVNTSTVLCNANHTSMKSIQCYFSYDFSVKVSVIVSKIVIFPFQLALK